MLMAEKSVIKFLGLRGFLLMEDFYNREGSLQAHKTNKKH